MTDLPQSAAVQIVNTLSNLVTTLATLMFLPILTYLTLKQNRKAEQVADEVKEVKGTLAINVEHQDKKLDEVAVTLDATSKNTDKKLDTIHTLVNGAMSSQMKISAVALRRVADLSKHPDDIAAAELAETTYREHQSKQKDVERL